jgi:hypothetical protein
MRITWRGIAVLFYLRQQVASPSQLVAPCLYCTLLPAVAYCY